MPACPFAPIRSKVPVIFTLVLLSGAGGCKKEVPDTPAQTVVIYSDTVGLPPNAVADVEGNVYQTVVIGTRRWMTTNLRTAHYRNGDPIPYVPDNAAWSGLSTGAWANYDNDAAYDQVIGKLYNWDAVIDSRNVCPTGWHVPTDDEWKDLELALGMPVSDLDDTGPRGSAENVGGHLKAITLWEDPNQGADDSLGFSGLPGGSRSVQGAYFSFGSHGIWWSSTPLDTDACWSRWLFNINGSISRLTISKRQGLSVRCVKD